MNTKSRTSRAAVAVLAALMAIVFIGCSGGGPSTAGPSAVAPGSASIVVLSRTLDEVEPGGQRIIDFSLPHRGALALTVRWNDPTNTVIAVLTSTGCRDFRSAGADCPEQRSVEHEGREGREQVIADPDAAGFRGAARGVRGPASAHPRAHRAPGTPEPHAAPVLGAVGRRCGHPRPQRVSVRSWARRTRKIRRTDPRLNSSPSSSRWGPVSFSPRTNVPCRLPRSSITA